MSNDYTDTFDWRGRQIQFQRHASDKTPAPVVPDGWKLVPIESTGPMVNAAWEAVNGAVGTGTIDAMYDAMIANAPEYTP